MAWMGENRLKLNFGKLKLMLIYQRLMSPSELFLDGQSLYIIFSSSLTLGMKDSWGTLAHHSLSV